MRVLRQREGRHCQCVLTEVGRSRNFQFGGREGGCRGLGRGSSAGGAAQTVAAWHEGLIGTHAANMPKAVDLMTEVPAALVEVGSVLCKGECTRSFNSNSSPARGSCGLAHKVRPCGRRLGLMASGSSLDATCDQSMLHQAAWHHRQCMSSSTNFTASNGRRHRCNKLQVKVNHMHVTITEGRIASGARESQEESGKAKQLNIQAMCTTRRGSGTLSI